MPGHRRTPGPSHGRGSYGQNVTLGLRHAAAPPGRREWNGVAPVALPFPGTNTQGPPEGWQQVNREERLLHWESVAVSLDIAFKLPMSRGLVHDFFQFLVLPGSQNPTVDAKDGLCIFV